MPVVAPPGRVGARVAPQHRLHLSQPVVPERPQQLGGHSGQQPPGIGRGVEQAQRELHIPPPLQHREDEIVARGIVEEVREEGRCIVVRPGAPDDPDELTCLLPAGVLEVPGPLIEGGRLARTVPSFGVTLAVSASSWNMKRGPIAVVGKSFGPLRPFAALWHPGGTGTAGLELQE